MSLLRVPQGCVGGSDSLCSQNNSERSFWKDTGHAELPLGRAAAYESLVMQMFAHSNLPEEEWFKLIQVHLANWVFEVVFHLFLVFLVCAACRRSP